MRQDRPCPCVSHRGVHVPHSTRQRHAGQLARGVLARWSGDEPVAPEPVAVEQDPDDAKCQLMMERVGREVAIEITELVALNLVKATGADAVVKIYHRKLGEIVPEDVDLPQSWYMCRKEALAGKEPVCFSRQFCHECDYLFMDNEPTDALYEPHCPGCEAKNARRTNRHKKNPVDLRFTRFDMRGKPRVAYYFDVDDKVRRLFADKVSAKEAKWGTARAHPGRSMEHRHLDSAWDGSIMEELFHNCTDAEKIHYLYFVHSNDGVEVEKNISYTPLTAKLLNFPPLLRGMLSAIWLLGFLPPHVKNYQNMLLPMVDMFARRAPGEEPVEVFDAHTGEDANKWLVIASLANDIRGVPGATCGRHPPCKVGSCNFCHVEGVRHRRTTVLPGSVRALPPGVFARP